MSDEPSKSVLLSSAGTSVTTQENTATSQRSGTVTFTQKESNKPGYVRCNQAEGTVSYGYDVECRGYSSDDRYINIHSYSVDIRASRHDSEQVWTQVREYTKINGRIIAERILPVTNITINNIYDRPSFLSFNAGSSSITVTLIGNPGEYGSWIMDVTFYTSKGKIDSALDIYYDI